MSLPTVTLVPTDVETTRLGFGCAGLLRDASAKGRQAVLEAAYDAGVRHFDVARMYGLGRAEAELGRFAAAPGRRDELVIATKFGIDPSGAVQRLAALQAPARRLLARYPQLKRLVKRREDGLYEPRRYDGAGARASLETSLRELGTDHVDVLFLHGPGPLDDVRTDDVCAELERLREQGKLRAWGVSGAPEPTLALMPRIGGVTQVYDDPWVQAAARVPEDTAPVTFGVIAATLDAVTSHLRADAAAAARWSDTLGADCTQPSTVAALALRAALKANPRGAVLFSTTKPAHVRAAAAAVLEAADEDQLAAFTALVTAEVAAPEGET